MTTIKTIIHNGRVQIDEPVDLPEGAEVEVTINMLPVDFTLRGMTEEEQGDTPEAIERWIALAESIPAITMSDRDWEAWHQRRKEDREWQLADVVEREKRLQRNLE
jgi:predicted DNA-binding antitoxin AbrB/MazE fold protein